MQGTGTREQGTGNRGVAKGRKRTSRSAAQGANFRFQQVSGSLAGRRVGGMSATRHVLLLSKAHVPAPKSGVQGMKKPLPESCPEGLFLESVLSMAGSNN